jgi:excisionase family DNA binding protein
MIYTEQPESYREPWLSVDHIATHLGISKETVYRWLERKRIPAHKIGRQWKFKISEVDQWVRDGLASEKSRGENVPL